MITVVHEGGGELAVLCDRDKVSTTENTGEVNNLLLTPSMGEECQQPDRFQETEFVPRMGVAPELLRCPLPSG